MATQSMNLHGIASVFVGKQEANTVKNDGRIYYTVEIVFTHKDGSTLTVTSLSDTPNEMVCLGVTYNETRGE